VANRYLDAVAVDAVGLDWTIELEFARSMIQKRRPVQGNLDPLAGGVIDLDSKLR
jgi:uroporphyrinogen decarboxylase